MNAVYEVKSDIDHFELAILLTTTFQVLEHLLLTGFFHPDISRTQGGVLLAVCYPLNVSLSYCIGGRHIID